MKGLSAEDILFLETYRQAQCKRLAGTASGWELRWLARHAELARQLVQGVRKAEVA